MKDGEGGNNIDDVPNKQSFCTAPLDQITSPK